MNTTPPGVPQPPFVPPPFPSDRPYIPVPQVLEGQTGQETPPEFTPPEPQPMPYPPSPYPPVQYPSAPYPQYTYPPPTSAYPAYPGAWAYGTPPPTYPPTTGSDEGIGPERVPWHWYDVLGASFIFILTAAATVVTSVAKGGLTTTPTTTSGSNVNHDALLIANLIGTVIIYGIVLGIIAWRTVLRYHVPWSALGVRKAPVAAFALMIPIYIVMVLIAGGLGELVNKLFYGGKAQNPQIEAITGGGGFSWIALITAILSASIIAPIVEELLFRGMLYGLLRSRWPSAVLAVIADGALFAAAHGIGLILASIFVVGVTLCIVYEKTKSTLVTMTLHCLFNSVSVATVFITLATGGKL